jgi:hypothetical protein
LAICRPPAEHRVVVRRPRTNVLSLQQKATIPAEVDPPIPRRNTIPAYKLHQWRAQCPIAIRPTTLRDSYALLVVIMFDRVFKAFTDPRFRQPDQRPGERAACDESRQNGEDIWHEKSQLSVATERPP